VGGINKALANKVELSQQVAGRDNSRVCVCREMERTEIKSECNSKNGTKNAGRRKQRNKLHYSFLYIGYLFTDVGA
jgi:hypothetical protein